MREFCAYLDTQCNVPFSTTYKEKRINEDKIHSAKGESREEQLATDSPFWEIRADALSRWALRKATRYGLKDAALVATILLTVPGKLYLSRLPVVTHCCR